MVNGAYEEHVRTKGVTDMAKFSRKGRKRRKRWSSGGRHSFSSDEYTRYLADIDDSRMLRRDRGSRPGKTIHPHPTFREKIEIDDKAMIDGLREEAEKGNIQAWFRLGKEHVRLGDLREAEYWLCKVAALGGWPEAEAELSLVRRMLYPDRTRSCDENAVKACSDVAATDISVQNDSASKNVPEEHPFVNLPRIAEFEICEIVMRRGEKKYLVLVRRKKSVKMEVMGHVLRETGFDVATDLYDTELDARNAGLLARHSWGRPMSQERETRYHLRECIEKFLSDISR